MTRAGGLFGRIALAMAGKGSPWGGPPKPEGERGEDGTPKGDPPKPGDKPSGPRNPWLPGGSDGDRRRAPGIEDIFRHRGPEGPRRGGGGPPSGPRLRLPQIPGGKNLLPLAIGGIAVLWLAFSTVHQLGPKEEGIVTTFGKYSRTINSGVSLTLPWPIQSVDIEPVSQIRIFQIPDSDTERLMLTSDQNLVDLSYLVRWNIKDLKQYRFQLAEPESTVREVGEAAMRASVAEEPLNTVFSGAGRADIETQVAARMQQVLDTYHAGINIQGVEIRKTDPPSEVEDAFKNVSAAQQQAESFRNQAEAAAQQVLARAQGDAAAFDKVYGQYKLAPEVTRRRMYYETMERVLSKTDKTIIEAGNVTPYLPLPAVKGSSPKPDGGQ